MAAPGQTARSRDPPQGDEEASTELKLGEFQDVITLTHSEAYTVINAMMQKRREGRKALNDTDIYQKTMDYLDHFARFKNQENIEAVERLLDTHKSWMAKFERAQLGSLCCDSAEEAKTLIPSLTDKISDEDLQEILDEITKLMGYGS